MSYLQTMILFTYEYFSFYHKVNCKDMYYLCFIFPSILSNDIYPFHFMVFLLKLSQIDSIYKYYTKLQNNGKITEKHKQKITAILVIIQYNLSNNLGLI